jgi:MFS transporter, OPA family, glycerol-3-phosphate transporter
MKWLSPPGTVGRLDELEDARVYPRFRMQILASSFLGYASFYLVRNNLSSVAKDLGTALHYDKAMMGDILGMSAIAYGFGKLFMGAWSDQSDARKFLTLGLILTAICNFAFGMVASYPLHLVLWTLNGFIQGMGWGPCGRALGQWFSVKERGTVFALWNIAHNVGGGIAGVVSAYAASHFDWTYAFFIPGVLALVGSVVVWLSLRDSPESVGLPSIDVYQKVEAVQTAVPSIQAHVLPIRKILWTYVLSNRLLWIAALANFFVYIVRYSMLDWGPTYLREMKGATVEQGGWAVAMIEFGGIPSTILVGWFSDRLGGRRGMVSLLCMIPTVFAFLGILYNPPGHIGIDLALLVTIGFCVYPPVMLLGVMGLDIGGKLAVGAAAGFIGLLGYFGRTAQAKLIGSMLQNHSGVEQMQNGWHQVLLGLAGCSALSILLLLPLWKVRPKPE